MTLERNLTIHQIKIDQKRDGTTFYKIYFNEKKYTYMDPTTNLQMEGFKVHFIWPDNQAYYMIQEKQYTEGQTVQIETEENQGYISIKTIQTNSIKQTDQGKNL